MKRISILILLVFFSCSSSVLAAGHHKTTETHSADPYARAVEVAVVYWGRSMPCRGLPVVRLSTAPPIAEVSAGPLQSALVKGAVELEAWVNLREAARGECVVFLNNSIWNVSGVGILEFHKLCNTVTHEVGHFMGHEDQGATDRNSITYPEETPENENSVSGCIRYQYPHSITSRIAYRLLRREQQQASR